MGGTVDGAAWKILSSPLQLHSAEDIGISFASKWYRFRIMLVRKGFILAFCIRVKAFPPLLWHL